MREQPDDHNDEQSKVGVRSRGKNHPGDVDRDSRSSLSFVMFAFAIALMMATILFVSVGFNPKDESFGRLPWLYAGGALLGSATCWLISRRLDRPR